MQATVTPRTFESCEQAGGWMRATFSAWADGLSDAEHDAILYYASPAYKTLNLALREPRPLNRLEEQHVGALDRALRVPLPEPVIAYRGVELEQPVDFSSRAGQPVVFRAYVSTSLLRPIAEGFCALASTKHHAVLFETVLAAGTRVGCPDLVQPTFEAELLLPRLQPLLLGEALPPAPGRRYWTVKLHAADRPLLDESNLREQHRAVQPLRDQQLTATPPATLGPQRPASPLLPPPSQGPSLGR
jgi:hypothetical protein